MITGRLLSTPSVAAVPVPGAGRVVDTVAALRALTGDAATPAVALRSSALASGGVFVWTPTAGTDDGVDRFNAGGLASSAAGWQRVASRSLLFPVLDYGATGDGVTDDTAAILALDAAVSVSGGGVLMFGPGVYVYDGTELSTGVLAMVLPGATFLLPP